MLIKIANMKDPDQKQSDLGLCCLSRPFGQATNVQNFRFTVFCNQHMYGFLRNRLDKMILLNIQNTHFN